GCNLSAVSLRLRCWATIVSLRILAGGISVERPDDSEFGCRRIDGVYMIAGCGGDTSTWHVAVKPNTTAGICRTGLAHVIKGVQFPNVGESLRGERSPAAAICRAGVRWSVSSSAVAEPTARYAART